MASIKTLVSSYIEVDDEISEINKKVKELRLKKKEFEESIKTYMEENSLDKVDLGPSSLKISKSVTQKKVGKKEILPVLIDNKLKEDNINDIVTELFDSEEPEEKTRIVRSRKK